eukprot:459685_1
MSIGVVEGAFEMSAAASMSNSTLLGAGLNLLQSGTDTVPTIRVSPVPNSVARDTRVLVHESRQAIYKPVLGFDDSFVMSAVFQCTRTEGLIMQFPPTITARIDRSSYPTGNITNEDICFGFILLNGQWQCLVNAVTFLDRSDAPDSGINARATLPTEIPGDNSFNTFCVPALGRSIPTYAFILNPVQRQTQVANTQNFFAANWKWILIGVVCGGLLIAASAYTIIRLSRYRKKYHSTRNEMELANKELDEIAENDELGFGHFASVGPGAHMQVNPLSQAVAGGEDEEILAEKRALRDEIQRQRHDNLVAQQRLQTQEGAATAGHMTEMGGIEMARRDI